MPDRSTKHDVIAYFEEKKQRKAPEGEAYFKALDDLLDLLRMTEAISEIKAAVRNLHRNMLREIQNTESVEVRIELRKQLDLYDDCLTQLRHLPPQ